jgi:type II secretory pathway component PulF
MSEPSVSPDVPFAGRRYPGTTFWYRAARPDGTMEQGSIAATSPALARDLIAARGYWLVDMRVERALPGGNRLSPADLGLGLRMLASLIDSGLPLGRALTVLGDLVPDSWRGSLPAIHDAVRRGEPLARSLATAPIGVPAVVIGIIQAGESGSGLASAVRRAASLMEEAASRRAAFRAALAYPLLLAMASVSSVSLLVGVVLPRFAAILADLGQALPLTTRLVLTGAEIARRAALPVAISGILGMCAWYSWVNTPEGRTRWHNWLLSVPVVGQVRLANASAGWARALSALLSSGVSIAPALRSAADAGGDAAIASRVLRARDRIVHGAPIAPSLDAEVAGTPTVIRLARAGEQTGRLAELLGHAATLDQEWADRAVRNAVRTLEPLLILIFGGFVGLIAAALLQAVYSVRPNL